MGHRPILKLWSKYGSREAYAEVRRRESLESMLVAGVKDVLFLPDLAGGESFVDQELFHNLRPAFEQLSGIVQRRMNTAILTLAYEGGHPDHDCCSFLAGQLAKRFGIPCWEAPLYHRLANGEGQFQQFIDLSGEEVDVKPTASELETKRAMCLAYSSQGDFLSRFDITHEKVRPQIFCDYTLPPHGGETNYELWKSKITAKEVSLAFAEFLSSSTRRSAANR